MSIPILLVLCLVSLTANFLVEGLIMPGGMDHFMEWIPEAESHDSLDVEEEDGDEHFLLSNLRPSHSAGSLSRANFNDSPNDKRWAASPLLPPPKF